MRERYGLCLLVPVANMTNAASSNPYELLFSRVFIRK